jgi:putative hydrolase of the HAD superfamily
VIRAILCDLDDTLYEEAGYVASGLRVVACFLAERHDANADALYNTMQADIAAHGRGSAFNVALKSLGLPDDAVRVKELVLLYRAHRPQIVLYPDAARFLTRLHKWRAAGNLGLKTALVTDGLVEMQQNKVEALGLRHHFNEIVYCWAMNAPKPDPTGLREAAGRLGVEPKQCLVIGDRIDHDMQPARALGMQTMRIARGRYAHEPSSAALIDQSFAGFDGVLDYLESILKSSEAGL